MEGNIFSYTFDVDGDESGAYIYLHIKIDINGVKLNIDPDDIFRFFEQVDETGKYIQCDVGNGDYDVEVINGIFSGCCSKYGSGEAGSQSFSFQSTPEIEAEWTALLVNAKNELIELRKRYCPILCNIF